MIGSTDLITHVPWLVIDFEFSGMQKGETVKDEHIIEMSMIKYIHGHPVDSLVTLLNIGDRPISRWVSRMTGIWPNHLEGKPRFEHIANRAFSMFDDDPIIIAHNAKRDVMVLYHEFSRLGIDLQTHYLCTYRMASVVFGCEKSQGLISDYRLGTLAEYCGIPLKKAHRAQDDTEACAKLLVHMLQYFNRRLKSEFKEEINVGNFRKLGYIAEI